MPRQGLLRGAGEDTIHSDPIVPTTPGEKARHWWEYHKRPLILIVIGVLVVFSILYSVLSKVKPDYNVALLTSYNMPQNARNEIARALEAYADDRNGDGKVKVSVTPYTIDPSEAATPDQLELQYSQLARFAADTSTNDSMLYLFDEEAFQLMQENFGGYFLYNDGSDMPENAYDFENARRSWTEFAGLSAFQPRADVDDEFTPEVLTEIFSRLWVYRRSAQADSIQSNEKTLDYFGDSLAFYDRLLSGEKPE